MSQCAKCGGKGYVEVHQPGHTHYETDAGEGCPSYHYERVPCTCNRIAQLEAEVSRLTLYSDFGGNNEADSKLRQHCIALEAENERLTAERDAVLEDAEERVAKLFRERDALATRCGELEAALKTWRMLFTQAELLERVELDTKLTASFSTPK